VVYNVGEIAPKGEILCIVGAISAGWNTKIMKWFQKKKNICYFGMKASDAHSTPRFIAKVIKHMIWDWWRNNETNLVLCNQRRNYSFEPGWKA